MAYVQRMPGQPGRERLPSRRWSFAPSSLDMPAGSLLAKCSGAFRLKNIEPTRPPPPRAARGFRPLFCEAEPLSARAAASRWRRSVGADDQNAASSSEITRHAPGRCADRRRARLCGAHHERAWQRLRHRPNANRRDKTRGLSFRSTTGCFDGPLARSAALRAAAGCARVKDRRCRRNRLRSPADDTHAASGVDALGADLTSDSSTLIEVEVSIRK